VSQLQVVRCGIMLAGTARFVKLTFREARYPFTRCAEVWSMYQCFHCSPSPPPPPTPPIFIRCVLLEE